MKPTPKQPPSNAATTKAVTTNTVKRRIARVEDESTMGSTRDRATRNKEPKALEQMGSIAWNDHEF
jgi:hypothetical protein